MLGVDFKKHRKALGYTQEELAEIFDVSKPTIISIEKKSEVAPIPSVYSLSMKYLVIKKTAGDLVSVVDKLENAI